MTDSTNQKPTVKLTQEKAYFVTEADGSRTRKTRTIDLAVGYENVSKNGNTYIRYTLRQEDITVDVDGVVKLVGFTIQEN